MNERDIERAAINEILKETKIAEERNKPPEYGYCINKRLLSRNLVSTLRNPVFPRNLRKRRTIGLDDETDDESDPDHKIRKYSSGQNRFADDDYIYDARDYFNPKKYREIVAYRNRTRQRRECYERKKSGSYEGCLHDVRENDYDDDKLQYRELQEYTNEEHEADVADDKSRYELLTVHSTSSYVLENTNNTGTCNRWKRKRHKTKDTSAHSQQKKRSKKSKHRHKDKLGCAQKYEDRKHGKHKKRKTRTKKNSRHKKKMESKKQKKSTCSSKIELGELNQHEVDDFSEIRSDCLGDTSPCGSHHGNEDSGYSVQSSPCSNGNISNCRQSEDDSSCTVEQFVNVSEASYEGSALVSAEYLNKLYFRTRCKTDNDKSIHAIAGADYDTNRCSDGVLDSASHCSGSNDDNQSNYSEAEGSKQVARA